MISCWFFKVIEEKINAYSFLSLADGYNYVLSALRLGMKVNYSPLT